MIRIIEKPVKFLGITLYHKKEIIHETYAEGLVRMKMNLYYRANQNSIERLTAKTFENSF